MLKLSIIGVVGNAIIATTTIIPVMISHGVVYLVLDVFLLQLLGVIVAGVLSIVPPLMSFLLL